MAGEREQVRTCARESGGERGDGLQGPYAKRGKDTTIEGEGQWEGERHRDGTRERNRERETERKKKRRRERERGTERVFPGLFTQTPEYFLAMYGPLYVL